MTKRICWECDRKLSYYDKGHIVTNFSASEGDWKIYCTECWNTMMKDKED